MAVIQIKRGQQSLIDSLSLAEGELAVALDTGNVYIGTTAGKVHLNPKGGTATSATKLETARTFSLEGDAIAQEVSFDGTENVVLNTTLADMQSLTPGTYSKVTVDSKGRVTAGTSATAADVGAIPSSTKGSAGGVAELGADGKVPASQLPSYVDDVVEYDTFSSFPETGEGGKIYVAKDTNQTYRWSGSAYVVIGSSLALGETSSTAYRGDRGKIAYDHSQTTGNPHNTTAADVGARPDTWMPSAADVGARPATWTPSASEVGAAPASHVEVVGSSSGIGHVKSGGGITINEDGTMTLTSVDGGTF